MDIWGLEYVEMAFRVWMCGGALEVLPCSRIGHLYRISTYSFGANPSAIKARNNARVAEVWMDEYKDIFYASYGAGYISAGNITDRLEFKKRLQCKSFRWYMENVFPEGKIHQDFYAYKGIVNVAENKCIDSLKGDFNSQLGLAKCNADSSDQFYAFAKSGLILTSSESCLSYAGNKVIWTICSNDVQSQSRIYNAKEQWIEQLAPGANACMRSNHTNIIMDNCNSTDPRFKWIFK